MKNQPVAIRLPIAFTLLLGMLLSLNLHAQDDDVHIIIHLRGVYETNISLLGQTPAGTFKPVTEVPGLKNGQKATISVARDRLSG